VIDLGDGLQLIEGYGGMHPADHDGAVRVDLFEDLGGAAGDREGVAADIHEELVVALDLLAQLPPRGHGPRGGDVGQQALTVHDRAQQAQAVILPLLMRAGRVDQVAQVAEIKPQAARAFRCRFLTCWPQFHGFQILPGSCAYASGRCRRREQSRKCLVRPCVGPDKAVFPLITGLERGRQGTL